MYQTDRDAQSALSNPAENKQPDFNKLNEKLHDNAVYLEKEVGRLVELANRLYGPPPPSEVAPQRGGANQGVVYDCFELIDRLEGDITGLCQTINRLIGL